MKILLLNRAFYPDSVATSQYITDIAQDLDAHGHGVTVVCGQRDYSNPAIIYPRFSVLGGIRIFRVGSTWFGKGRRAARILDSVSFDLMCLWRLARLPRQDLVIAFTSPPLAGLWGALAARWWRSRFVHWIMNVNHQVALETGYLRRGSLLAIALEHIQRFTLRASDRVVVMDQWMKARISGDDVIDLENIVTIPLWPVHEPEVSESAMAHGRSLWREHHLSNKFIVLHAGNLSHIHPLHTVLDAAVRLKDDPSVAFVFVGGGVRGLDIDDRVRREGLNNIVRLPYQRRENLGAVLALADLHLIVMGNPASGLAHSSKIYSILLSGQPYVFVGPRDSHIVSDVLEPCPGGDHVEDGDVAGLLSAIAKARAMSVSARQHIITMNRTFVSARFGRQQALTKFRRHVIEFEGAGEPVRDDGCGTGFEDQHQSQP